jgi:thiamine kinase-like enzyme
MERVNQIDWTLINAIMPPYTQVLALKYIKGLTNWNFLLKTDTFEIFYKILNTSFHEFINRDLEAFIIKKLTAFPQVNYINREICIREYYENARTVHFKELTGLFGNTLIESLLELHSIGKAFPEARSPRLIYMLSDDTFYQSIRDYVNTLSDKEKTSYLEIIDYFQKCSSVLLPFCQKYEKFSFLCHNDLTLENMLIIKKSQDASSETFMLLDYEYADFNILFYEFANLFMEMEVEYTHEAPYFIFNKISPEIRQVEEKFACMYLATDEGKSLNLSLKGFLDICDAFKVFSHMFWVIVAIKSVNLGIAFDFDQYIKCRFSAFRSEFTKHFDQKDQQ